jgi:hypothetical protein
MYGKAEETFLSARVTNTNLMNRLLNLFLGPPGPIQCNAIHVHQTPPTYYAVQRTIHLNV